MNTVHMRYVTGDLVKQLVRLPVTAHAPSVRAKDWIQENI